MFTTLVPVPNVLHDPRRATFFIGDYLKQYFSYLQYFFNFFNLFCIHKPIKSLINPITSATNLPHPGNPRLNGNPCSVMQLILLQLIRQNRSSSHQTHRPSLCQLRNNFFQKFLIKHSIINLPSK